MNSENKFSKQAQLITAVENGDLDEVKKLLAEGLDINTSNSFDENLLFLACRHGQLEMVNYLLDKNADLMQLNSGKQSIFNAASMGENLQIVKKLLEIKDSSSNANLKTIFTFGYGFYPKNFSIYEYFITNGLLTEENIKNLPLANYANDPLLLKIFELIFLYYPSLSLDTIRKLFASFIRPTLTAYQFKAMEYLLEKFPEIKTHFDGFFKELFFAFKLDDDMEDEVIDSQSETLNNQFIYAVKTQNECLEFLLQHGLSVDAIDAEGQTLLHQAALFQFDEYEHVSHLRCLIDMGYPINANNAKGQTPLQVAIEGGMFFHALYLIYRGANVSVQDPMGHSVIDYAKQFCELGDSSENGENLRYRKDLLQVLKDYGSK